MIIGFFTDDKLGIEIPAGHPEPSPSKESPVILQSLAIMTTFIDCKGPFEAEISLYQPNGTALLEHQKIDGPLTSEPVQETNNINFIARFVPFSVPEFGQYKFVIKLDDMEYKYKFSIISRHH